MAQFFLTLLISGLAVFITGYILPGIQIKSFLTAVLVAVILGVVNAVIRPILLVLTLPLNVLTLGLFTFVINALMVLLVDALVPGFSVSNFWWALLFSLVLSFVNAFLFSLA